MSLRGNKRAYDDDNLEKIDYVKVKRVNDLCTNEVKKASEQLDVAIKKLSADERRLISNLFKFPVIASNQNCQICDIDVTKGIKVVCNECVNDEKRGAPFIFCIECLRKGKEKGSHKKGHPYFILDKMDFPLFEPEWTAQDDISLLKEISLNGIDNWLEISNQMNHKSPEDCEAHFYSFYYKSQEDPIPKIEDIGTVMRDKSNNEPKTNQSILKSGKSKKDKFIEQKSKHADNSKYKSKSRSNKNNDDSDEGSKQQENPISDVRSLVGYMPKRGDFDTEYDDEAETRICEMEFSEDDTEEEKNLKYKVLEYYNARLDERIKRKKFVVERGLLDLKKIQKQEKRRSKEERDIINVMKPFARFSDKKEHERRVNSLLKEYQLRVLIGQLKYFRSQGLTTLDQVETHIEEKKDSKVKKEESKDYQETLGFVKEQKTLFNTNRKTTKRLRRNPHQGVEITSSTAFSKLSEDEKDLVVELNMMPDVYLKVKKLMIDENTKNSIVKNSFIEECCQAEAKSHMNPQQSLIIYNFLAKNGDITKEDDENLDADMQDE